MREAAGFSQEELAERAGLSSHAISALERGTRTRPYPHTVRALCDALGADADARAALIAAVPARPRSKAAPGIGPVKLVAVTHVPTQGGPVNPAEEIGVATREAGVPYLLDACQSVGQFPVDVDQIGCDLLSAPGRKYLRGPRGRGFLYVRDTMSEQLEPPFLDLHAATWTAPDRYEIRPDARRLESCETNYAAKIGLGVAVDYALSWGLEAIDQRVTALAHRLRELLSEVKGVSVHDQGRRRCGIVTFTVDGVSSQEVQQRLATAGINVSVSLVEYARLDLPERRLPDLARASVHYYNTEGELKRLIDAISPPR